MVRLNIYDLVGTAITNSQDIDLAGGSPLDNALQFTMTNNTGQTIADARGTATSYPVDAPRTTANEHFYNFWWTQCVQVGKELAKKNFVIYVNNVPRRSGVCQLESMDKRTAKITLWLDNEELFRLAANTKVWELLQGWSIPYDNTAIDNTVIYYLTGADEFCYVPVKARSWEIHSAQRCVTERDFWAVISAKKVFDELCTRLNPAATYESSIFTEAVWKRVGFLVNLSRPYNQQVTRQLSDLQASSSAIITATVDDPSPPPTPYPLTWIDDDSTGINFDVGNVYDTATQTYTAAISGLHSFNLHLEYTLPIPTDKLYPVIYASINSGAPTQVGGGNLRSEFDFNLSLEAGDTVELLYNIINWDFSTPVATYDFSLARLTVQVKDKNFGSDLIVSAALPASWEVSTWLAAFFGMFNLRMYFNTDSRVIYFEPYRGWQNEDQGGGTSDNWLNRVVDMTGLVSFDESIANREGLAVQLDYDESPDETITEADKFAQIPTGAFLFERTDRNDRQLGNVKLPAAKINHILDSTLVNDPATGSAPFYPAPYLPLIYSEVHNLNESGVGFNDTDALCFVFTRFSGLGLRAKIGSGAVNQALGYGIAYQVYLDDKAPEPYVSKFYSNKSLTFADYVAANGRTIMGLGRRFYLEGLAASAVAKRYTAFAKLPDSFLSNNDTRALWRIGQNVYEVEQVKFMPENEVHEVVLLEHQMPENCEAFVFNSDLKPLVIYG